MDSPLEWTVDDVLTETVGWQRLHLYAGETVCPSCKGAGRWDSCFDCGNRGHLLATQPDGTTDG